MTPFIPKAATWLRRRAENILAGMLAILFVAFILQIVFRYLFNFPVGWTAELSVIAWLWLVMWATGFVAKESEEIRFDIVSGAVGPRTARVMGIIAAISIVALYVAALPATYKYISFMKIEKSSYLHIRLDILFSAFGLYIVAVIVRYLWILWDLLRGKTPTAVGSTTPGSGL
ncbi:MAG: TRAP transporter small permease subunit [Betaproteobacteria bacterium]|nr:MAG: TRAP transporter small permease subunit [Betaproteobacteria bacterium]TMH90939.1 MAG: TRAP transporter small permease subunit [Betaproteobacteria bacterium]